MSNPVIPLPAYNVLLGANIRLARETANMTQDRFARIAGLDRRRLWHYETGQRKPNERSQRKIADALGLPVAWFYTYHPEADYSEREAA